MCAHSYCNDCRDLDLCRDPALQAGTWACPACAEPYDKAALENRLMHAACARARAFQLQDLTCMRCRQVRAS